MLQNICRICAIATDATDATKLFESNNRQMLRQIKLITGVLLEAKADLPDLMCKACQNDLHCAMEFRRRCLRNHKRWTSLPTETKSDNELSASPSTTHVICVRRSKRSRAFYKSEDDLNWNPSSPAEEFIKLESVENNADVDDGVDHLNTETNDNVLEIDNSEDETYVPEKKTKSIKQPKQKQQIIVYFCDQCGKKLKGKSALDRHLRKHSGDRPFKCDQCPSCFLSAGELKGHQVMHTGARDFPCRYCDRAYVNYSGRLRHERTHTNDRPFACTQCSKAFTTSYILKNHMLVHTGERMFRCEPCERSFSRETHLQAHYRSNTHKNNIDKSITSNPQLPTVEEVCAKPEIILTQSLIETQQPVLVVAVDIPYSGLKSF